MTEYTKIARIIRCLKKIIPTNSFMPFDEIKNNLLKQIEVTNEELIESLQIMNIKYGNILRKDNIIGNPTYQLLNRDNANSLFQMSYRNLYDNNPTTNKKILLISDTHIGSNKENYELINNVYNFAVTNNATCCIHLGDIFHSLKYNYSIEKVEELKENFQKYYPANLKTYAIAGNHDKYMHTAFPLTPLWEEPKISDHLDLRVLNTLNNNFIFYPSMYLSATINNQPFHFSHKLYINEIVRDIQINSIDDIDEESHWFSFRNKILISGHLHQGIIYTTDKENVYIGVPSTSNVNINGIVAYMIDITTYNIIIRVLKESNNKIDIVDEHDLNYYNMPIIKKWYKR